jgi:hypothetical protein
MIFKTAATLAMLAGLGLALASCQTLNEAECQTVSWQTLGQQDGAQGRATTYIGRHQEACSKHGLPIDTVAWQSGWEQGIRQYCTPDNALNRGRNGQSGENNCPADLSAGFSNAYQVGRAVYDAQAERDRLTNDLNAATQSIVSAATTEERAVIQTRLVTLQAQIPEAERRLSRARERYDDYRFGGYRGGFPGAAGYVGQPVHGGAPSAMPVIQPPLIPAYSPRPVAY